MRILNSTRRLVIDTNVLVSALLSPKGTAAKLMEDVFDNAYETVVTNSIIEEYIDVLNRPKFRIDKDIIEFVVQWFKDNSLWVEVDEDDYPKEEMPDPDDAVFYVTARCTGSLLVTKNIKHYPVTEWRTMIWELI